MNNEQEFKKGDLVSAYDKNEKKIYGVFIEYDGDDGAARVLHRQGVLEVSWAKVAWQDGTIEEENIGDLLLEARIK